MHELVCYVDLLKPLPACPVPTLRSLWEDRFVIGEPRAYSAHHEDGGSKGSVLQVETRP